MTYLKLSIEIIRLHHKNTEHIIFRHTKFITIYAFRIMVI